MGDHEIAIFEPLIITAPRKGTRLENNQQVYII